MALQINASSIQKLGHDLPEIRVRTLKHIEGKIIRAFQQNEHIELNSGNLIKQLIRWFGMTPLCEEETVLNLMLTIFRSRYADEAIKYLQIERLKKEIGKIYEIIKLSHEKKNIVILIKEILENYQSSDDSGTAEDSSDRNELISLKSTDTDTTIDLCSLSEVINDEFSPDYERPWSSPSARDYNSLKSLSESLSSECKTDELEHAFDFLKTAINDYPAEYFLQPPYICKGLLTLYTKNTSNKVNILENLSYLTKSIIGRIKTKQSAETYCIQEKNLLNSRTQITIGRYCSELFSACIEHLKDFHENITPQEIYFIFKLLFDLINLLETDVTIYIPMKSVLTDLALIAKYYRNSLQSVDKPKRLNRIQYVLIIFIISKLISNTESQNHPTPINNSVRTSHGKCSTRRNYNPNNYNENFYASSNLNLDLWKIELENSLLDFPFRQLHPVQYECVMSSIKFSNTNIDDNLEILLNCEKFLKPAIKLLRQPENYTNEEFIYLGYEAMDTLSLHKSLDFVKKIIEIISKSIPLFDGNLHLRNVAEKIILRLLAHENFKIRRLAYKESANKMKYFFGALMNGENTLNKIYNSQLQRAKTFGIPLTTEIISEIISFGYNDSDTIISQNAETMLSLIIKGRSILDAHWQHLLEILLPNFPLLQCLTVESTNLGKLILNLLHPDTNITDHNLFQGNLRLLFCSDQSVRIEALSRLVYILTTDSNGFDYLPNVLEISDTLPNDICVVTVPRNPEKIFSGGIYDITTVQALLSLLKTEDVKPDIRKTTLIQLNVICQDTELIEIISNENGWYFVIQALENSLKKEPCMDYPDSAIPAIGVISKLTLFNSEFRRELSKEGNIYILLLRALFLFHHDITLQQDCSLALFLLLFSSHILPVNGGKQISVPKIFNQLQLPIKCNYHWEQSPNIVITKLEEIYRKLSENEITGNQHITTNNNDEEIRSRLSNYQQNTNEPVDNKNEKYLQFGLQFIRMQFATNWFNGFDQILPSLRKTNSNKSTTKTTLDYNLIQDCCTNLNVINNDGVTNIIDIFKFNRNLELTISDLRIIKFTSTQENIKSFLRYITNSTNLNDFLDHLFGLQLTLQLLSQQENIEILPVGDDHIFLDIFRKYLINQPQNDIEFILFDNIIKLFTILIKLKNENIFIWILENLQYERQFMLLQLLRNYDLPIQIYENICDFFKELITNCYNNSFSGNLKINNLIQPELQGNENNNVQILDTSLNIYCKLFEFLIPIMEECFHKRLLNRVRAIVSLVEVITASNRVEIDSGFMHIIAKKLLYFIMTLKSFTQAGSHLNKNCLLIILNLVDDIDEFVLDENHIKFLSGFCSHPDYEIRLMSWTLLIKIAGNLRGAHLIVKELSYLPGGFHACCLSTLLDNQELPTVRGTAGGLFSNLLLHTGSNGATDSGGLHMSVAPLCIEQEPSSFNNGLELIKQIFEKHRFYAEISESLNHFHISETVDNIPKQLTTCEIVRTYCSILINFVDLDSELLNELSDKLFLVKIFNLIKTVPSYISQESLEMTSEICNLILRFENCETKFVQRNLGQDQGYLEVLIYLLNLKYYENFDKTTITNILNVLKMFANDSNSYQLICEIFSCNGSCRVLEILRYGTLVDADSDLQNSCLKFLISLYIKSSEELYKFNTLPDIFEQTKIVKDNDQPQINRESNNQLENRRKSRKRTLNENDEITGSEIILKNLLILFEQIFSNKSRYKLSLLAKKTLICESIAVLLKSSEKARITAKNENLFELILTNINSIFENMGMTCTDFIRKYGDAKKNQIIQELGILYGIILNWYSSDTLEDPKQILEFSKISVLAWPWISHSENFRIIFTKTLAFLSEDSIEVCKQFSTSITSFGNSVIQLTIKLVSTETNKVKHPQIDFTTLELGLRILSNCSACIEGRLQIIKHNLLEVFNRFHPSVTKLQKTWNTITLLWLEFWQIFSRHEEGAALHHLILLCALVTRGNLKIRLHCLKVIRNMSFLPNNRSALLASQDFLSMITSVLTEGNYDEKLLVSGTIWKLIADNYKAKHIIKTTSIPRKLRKVIETLPNEDNKLAGVAEIILNILDA